MKSSLYELKVMKSCVVVIDVVFVVVTVFVESTIENIIFRKDVLENCPHYVEKVRNEVAPEGHDFVLRLHFIISVLISS